MLYIRAVIPGNHESVNACSGEKHSTSDASMNTTTDIKPSPQSAIGVRPSYHPVVICFCATCSSRNNSRVARCYTRSVHFYYNRDSPGGNRPVPDVNMRYSPAANAGRG